MMGILKMLGVMTVEASNKAVNDAKADLQRRLTDEEVSGTRTALDLSAARKDLATANETVARQAEALTAAEKLVEARDQEIAGLKAELAAADNLAAGYRPDAEKWRDRAAREHTRRTKSRAPTAVAVQSTSKAKPVAAKAKKSPRKAA